MSDITKNANDALMSQSLAGGQTNGISPTTSQTTAPPLDQLRDIHLPSELNTFWPPFAFWLMGFFLVICILLLAKLIKTLRSKTRYKREALAIIKQLKNSEAKQENLQQISTLLKRIAKYRFDSESVAKLNQLSWLEFLNNSTNKKIFTEGNIQLLSHSMYKKELKCDQDDYNNLCRASEKWVQSL